MECVAFELLCSTLSSCMSRTASYQQPLLCARTDNRMVDDIPCVKCVEFWDVILEWVSHLTDDLDKIHSLLLESLLGR